MRILGYVVLIEEDEDGILVGSSPDFKSCHTQAKTVPELLKRMEEAIKLCIQVEKNPPKPLKFVGLQEIKVAV